MDPDDAITEAKHCLEDLALTAVFRRPEHFPGVLAIHDERYEPLWSYLEEANATLVTHSGLSGLIPSRTSWSASPSTWSRLTPRRFRLSR